MKKFTAPQIKLILEMDDRLRDLERTASADPNDAESRSRYRKELIRKLSLESVEVVRCIGIYKMYDSGLNSPNMFFVANKELANLAITMLNEDDGGIHYVEGEEWSLLWNEQKAIAELDDVLLTSADVQAAILAVREE